MNSNFLKVVKKISLLLLSIGFGFIVLQGCGAIYWSIVGLSYSPDNYMEKVDEFRALPTEELLKELTPFFIASPHRFMAIKAVNERKEKQAVPILIKQSRSWNNQIRIDAIWSLGVIGDSRAIEPLMKIVREGEKHPNYVNALSALSKMRYDGAYKYVVERAKKPDAYRNGSVGMLKEFGRPESIPLLVEIKKNVPSDVEGFGRTFSISQINDAIEYLESLKSVE
jgi:HEAT repeat protein